VDVLILECLDLLPQPKNGICNGLVLSAEVMATLGHECLNGGRGEASTKTLFLFFAVNAQYLRYTHLLRFWKRGSRAARSVSEPFCDMKLEHRRRSGAEQSHRLNLPRQDLPQAIDHQRERFSSSGEKYQVASIR